MIHFGFETQDRHYPKTGVQVTSQKTVALQKFNRWRCLCWISFVFDLWKIPLIQKANEHMIVGTIRYGEFRIHHYNVSLRDN